MTVITRGDRELSKRFETFPQAARQKLIERIDAITEALAERIRAGAPYRTGKLSGEIVTRDYSDNPDRVAGYVQVYAPGDPKEYAKAATLEYGSNKPRKIFDRRRGLLEKLSDRRALKKITKPVHIAALRYLRGPFEAMRPEIEAAIDEALAEAAVEQESS